MDREAWHAAVHGVAKSRRRLSDWNDTHLLLPLITLLDITWWVQWLKSCLPLWGTQIQSLVWEDHTCWEATKPASPVLRSNQAHIPQLLKLRSTSWGPLQGKPLKWEAYTSQLENSSCSTQLEKVHTQWRRPMATKTNFFNKLIIKITLFYRRGSVLFQTNEDFAFSFETLLPERTMLIIRHFWNNFTAVICIINDSPGFWKKLH